MENHPHESIDTVFGCVIPYIHDRDDRNVVSLVCRKWYELDCMTRKHLTVHLAYSPAPSRLHQRFPSIESLTLQGFPDSVSEDMHIFITEWIQEISVSYKCLKELHVRHVCVCDSDLELLARTRGKDLRLLKIFRCCRFSTDGLMHIGKYCTHLKSLSLEGSEVEDIYGLEYTDGKWFHELALHNSSIESLDFGYADGIDVNDLTLLAKNCSQSLVSFKLRQEEIDLVDLFRYAVRLEDVDVGKYVDVGIKIPPNLRCMRMFKLNKSSFQFVLPFAHQLRKLQIGNTLDVDRQCFLIKRCPNLEVFDGPYGIFADGIVDEVLQVIGRFCKKLRKLRACLRSCMGLIAVAQGCIDLECLDIEVNNITSENFECMGTYLKNLRDFSIWATHGKTTVPLDNGVRLMLIGCSKLERLGINLCHGALTDVGLGYIGKHGHILKHLSLGSLEENDLGLVELSKGCPKLRELVLTDIEDGYQLGKSIPSPVLLFD
ncbi:coronatine-insensitive protein 1-like protein [Tanacetum coccineum]